ncbi:MAG: DUF2147 domain-containing protein [Pseudomonadota bacterium]
MRLAALAIAAMTFAVPAQAKDIFDVWQSEKNDKGAFIQVEMIPCSADTSLLCGRIVDAINPTKAASDKPVWIGELIIENMKSSGANAWSDGTIWAPNDGSVYASKLKLEGDVLEVSGCVLGGLICSGQDWTRVK